MLAPRMLQFSLWHDSKTLIQPGDRIFPIMGYSKDKAVNCTLQMQVRQEVEKLKGNSSASSAADGMIVLSATSSFVGM